jgi:excisionase family DNA binding protein
VLDTVGMEKKPFDPILVSVKDAAGLLGVCPRTIQNLVIRKELSTRKLGRRTLLSYRELQSFAKHDHAILSGPAQAGGAQ